MYINLSVFFNVKSEMENYIVLQGKIYMKKEYYAHYRKEDDTFQKLEDHLLHTACLSMQYCPVPLLKRLHGLAVFIMIWENIERNGRNIFKRQSGWKRKTAEKR